MACNGQPARPSPALGSTLWSSILSGSSNAVAMRGATCRPRARSAPGISRANPSPPSRASTSPSRTTCCRGRVNCRAVQRFPAPSGSSPSGMVSAARCSRALRVLINTNPAHSASKNSASAADTLRPDKRRPCRARRCHRLPPRPRAPGAPTVPDASAGGASPAAAPSLPVGLKADTRPAWRRPAHRQPLAPTAQVAAGQKSAVLEQGTEAWALQHGAGMAWGTDEPATGAQGTDCLLPANGRRPARLEPQRRIYAVPAATALPDSGGG